MSDVTWSKGDEAYVRAKFGDEYDDTYHAGIEVIKAERARCIEIVRAVCRDSGVHPHAPIAEEFVRRIAAGRQEGEDAK